MEQIQKALATRAYLNVLVDLFPNIEPLYCQLCELVHPAQSSVSWMISSKPGTPWEMLFTGRQEARAVIERIVNEHSGVLMDVVKAGFHAAVVTLKVLRYFDIPELRLQFMDRYSLKGVNAWDQVKKKLRHG